MPLTAFPSDFPLEEGATVPLQGPGGQHLLASVMNRDEEKVTLDLNHPMAGKTLTFEIKIVNVDV
jgi:FKBP-type peptidyl-prolyl cis-trans isomerase 2